MSDPVEILVQHMAAALVRHGMDPERAREDAEERVAVVLEDLARSGAPVGLYLRRVRVYRLRCQGVRWSVISERLGLSRQTLDQDYKAELTRRRSVA